LNHARPNDFCNCIQRTLASTSGPSSRPRWCSHPGFPRAASLRPLMRGGEPCVPDRLEDRTPISCEWAEKEHTGRRAESKAEGNAPKKSSLGDYLGQRSCRSKSACRVAFLSPFLFLSSSTSSSSAWFRIRSWSARPNSVHRRRLPVSACPFQPHQPPTPALSNRVRLEATSVPPTPRRETAAWQPRCFPPLGIDVHGARALCVHRQVLRPRRRPFDRVPLPLEEGEFAFAVRRGRAFFYLTLLPDFDCVKQCLQIRRAPRGAPYRLFPA
jgi:hypothetical protein